MTNELFEDIHAKDLTRSKIPFSKLTEVVNQLSAKFNFDFSLSISHLSNGYNSATVYLSASEGLNNEQYFAILDKFNLKNGSMLDSSDMYSVGRITFYLYLPKELVKARKEAKSEVECKVEYVKFCPNATPEEKAALRKHLRELLNKAY